VLRRRSAGAWILRALGRRRCELVRRAFMVGNAELQRLIERIGVSRHRQIGEVGPNRN